MKIFSWNINGIRAAQKKGLLDWLAKESPDILCVQEIKAMEEQLNEEMLHPPGYSLYLNSAERKGYSGVATFTKEKPRSVSRGFGVKRFDCEGRVLITEFTDFILLNIYFPNGAMNAERLQFKLDFYDETLKFVKKLRKKQKNIIISGDYNTAHHEIDLARPKENEKVSGFLPEERAWLDEWVENGHVDTFRAFHPDQIEYTWWDMKTRARERNVGWRIDYHFATKELMSKVQDAKVYADVIGSDHCPISIELKI